MLFFRSHIEKPTLKYHCDCGKTFRKGEDLLFHKEIHCAIYATWRENNQYVDCPRCQERFDNVKEMQDHLALHSLIDVVPSDEKEYICSTCAKTFRSFDLYLQHKERGCWANPNSKPFQFDCNNCGLHFASKAVWVFHSRYCKENKMERKHLDWNHHGIHSCHTCRKHFKNRQSLKDHITWHVQESKFNCRVKKDVPDDNQTNENENQHLSDASDQERNDSCDYDLENEVLLIILTFTLIDVEQYILYFLEMVLV